MDRIIEFLISRNKIHPYLLFSPFLVLYIFIGVYFRLNGPIGGDEGHYFQFADNLRHGFYSPKHELDLWYGPGFPIYLLIGSVFGIPEMGFVILNAIFLFLTVVCFNKIAFKFLSNKRIALFSSVFLACYAVSYRMISFIHPELLTMCLVMFSLKYILYAFERKSNVLFVFTGLLIGYLALVKVVFGLIIFTLLIITVILRIFKNATIIENTRAFALLFVGIYSLLTPYLIYTYSLTGKVYYLGNSGGENLYFSTSLNPSEYGDWQDSEFILGNNNSLNVCALKYGYANFFDSKDYWKKSHFEIISKAKSMNSIDRNNYFIKLAFENIKKKPTKFIKNIGYNFSRLIFNLPNSYTFQDAKFWLLFFTNGMLLLHVLLLIPVIYLKFVSFNPEIKCLIFLYITYIGFHLVLSPTARHFWVVTPILLFILTWITDNFVRIKISLVNN